MHATGRARCWRAGDQSVLNSLVIPLTVIVRDAFRHGPSEMPHADFVERASHPSNRPSTANMNDLRQIGKH
jgi:hypothetical protein